MNQLKKETNIAELETSYQLCSLGKCSNCTSSIEFFQLLIFTVIAGVAMATANYGNYYHLYQHEFPGIISGNNFPEVMGVSSSRNVIDSSNVNHHHMEKRSPTLITKTLFKKLLLLKVLKKLKLG